MRKSDVEVGKEYAIALGSYTDLSRGIRGYAGKLAHGQLVHIDHPVEVGTRTKKVYVFQLVEGIGDRKAGDRVHVESGRLIVCGWGLYARELAEHRAKREAARIREERDDARHQAFVETLVRYGIIPSPAESDGKVEYAGTTQTRLYDPESGAMVYQKAITLHLDAADRIVEALASLAPVEA